MKHLSFILILLLNINLEAQNVGINGTGALANPSALLDVDASPTNNKGMLIPRVALLATNNQSPVTSPALSLMVYNTATASSGTTAVSPGFYYWNGINWIRFQYTSNGSNLDWSMQGNANTVDGTNFIGTTDNIPFNIRVNNQKAGRIDLSQNTFLGYQTGNSNTTGSINTAIGEGALNANATGSINIAIGSKALNKITTSNNIAIGNNALFNMITGNANVALGNGALETIASGQSNVAIGYNSQKFSTGSFNISLGTSALLNNTGSHNIAIGFSAIRNNTNGTNNTAIGSQSLKLNTTGQSNVAFGNYSLDTNTIGSFNVAMGTNALTNNTIGTRNTAVGYYSNFTNLIGEYNTAIGYRTLVVSNSNYNTALGFGAGDTVKTGDNNTFLGAFTNATSPSFSNVTAIGYGALAGANNVMVLGPATGTSVVNVGVGVSVPLFKLHVNGTTQCAGNVWTSDLRKKQNVKQITAGLEIINKLNPVTYEWKEVLDDGMKGTQMGFIAQELETIIPSIVVTSNNEQKDKGVKYNELLPVLVKAVQELSIQNKELLKEIELLKKKTN